MPILSIFSTTTSTLPYVLPIDPHHPNAHPLLLLLGWHQPEGTLEVVGRVDADCGPGHEGCAEDEARAGVEVAVGSVGVRMGRRGGVGKEDGEGREGDARPERHW
jgi:hypothetical protein